MSTLLTEYRISDLSQAASAIDSFFLKHSLDFNQKYFMNDVTMMKDPETIYTIFLANPLINMLYANQTPGDLYHIPSYFNIPTLNSGLRSLHFMKYNNIFLGASLTITNFSSSENNFGTMNNLYSKLNLVNKVSSNFSVVFPSGTQNFSDVDMDAFAKKYPFESFLKKYDESTIALLLPGEVNSSVAYFMMQQMKPFFFEASSYIKEISLSVHFFNPISEIYLDASFNYIRTLQGIISFQHVVKGGFPLMYASHQFDLKMANLYFGVKIIMYFWTICLFLYEFFTVSNFFIFRCKHLILDTFYAHRTFHAWHTFGI